MSATDCNCAALRQASRFVSRLYDEALAPVGLGINQYSILARLTKTGPLKQQDLARTLVMDRSTIGHLLRPLERRGLVVSVPGAPDGRCRIVSLTAAGEALLAAARPLWSAAQRDFEALYGASEAETLRAALTAVTALTIPSSPEPR
ncbi:MAG: winged helix-turn-helix transcriptional regulator [Caulobacteraceae bacterium]|nr:winged helix-turn-helix transcriptional regulator [Caulobacter sp.]